jgi:riboflavin transporter FmnP
MSQAEPFQRVKQRLRELLSDFSLRSVISSMLRKLKLPYCVLKILIIFLQLIYLTLHYSDFPFLILLLGVDPQDDLLSTFIDKLSRLLLLLQALLYVGNCIFELNDPATRPRQHLMVVVVVWNMI